jgi:uncharacterized phiE125 gp8 family phage protein
MTARQITPPAELAVTLASAKDTLRIEQADTAFDSLLTLWIEAITEAAEHEVGRCFVNQGWRVTLDKFPDAIRLDRAPLVSVQSVMYIDEDGIEQTLDPADYIVDSASEPGFIVPEPDVTWPCTEARVNAVTVDYTVGYGPDGTTVPKAAKLYILARLAEQFEPNTKEFKETVRSSFIGGLLDSLKCYG